MANFGFIILAGGKSSRMKTDKGLLEVNGKPLIKYVIDLAEQFTKDIIIVSNSEAYHLFNFPVVKDKYLNKGPIAGLHTGLLHSNFEMNIVLPCDTPSISKEVIQQLIIQAIKTKKTTVCFTSRLQPLIGVYFKSNLHQIEALIKADELKLTQLLSKINADQIDFSDRDEFEFVNLNTEADVKIFYANCI